jgi:hypothetical protein
VEQIEKDNDGDGNPEQPKQQTSAHYNLLFLAGDLADRVFRMADRALHPAFGLIGFSLGFRLSVANGATGLLSNLAGDFLHASCDTIFVHRAIPLIG